MISAKVAPLARLISAITSAFLLARDSVAPFAVRARRAALVGDFFDRVRSVATAVAGCATSCERRCTAFPDSGHCGLPVREFLYRFEVVERGQARETVPGFQEAEYRPARTELSQFLCSRKRLQVLDAGRKWRAPRRYFQSRL
jgi:hypothetical protein